MFMWMKKHNITQKSHKPAKMPLNWLYRKKCPLLHRFKSKETKNSTKTEMALRSVHNSAKAKKSLT